MGAESAGWVSWPLPAASAMSLKLVHHAKFAMAMAEKRGSASGSSTSKGAATLTHSAGARRRSRVVPGPTVSATTRAYIKPPPTSAQVDAKAALMRMRKHLTEADVEKHTFFVPRTRRTTQLGAPAPWRPARHASRRRARRGATSGHSRPAVADLIASNARRADRDAAASPPPPPVRMPPPTPTKRLPRSSRGPPRMACA